MGKTEELEDKTEEQATKFEELLLKLGNLADSLQVAAAMLSLQGQLEVASLTMNSLNRFIQVCA